MVLQRYQKETFCPLISRINIDELIKTRNSIITEKIRGNPCNPWIVLFKAFETQAFQENIEYEQAVRHQISFPKAAGFLDEAVEPFQGQVFHPLRSVLCVAGQVVEPGADADHHTAL